MFAFAALTLFVLAALLYKRLTSKQEAPYPPGPKGLPLIGNVLDIPPEYQWIKFGEWKKLYGELMKDQLRHNVLTTVRRRRDFCLSVRPATRRSQHPRGLH